MMIPHIFESGILHVITMSVLHLVKIELFCIITGSVSRIDEHSFHLAKLEVFVCI